jgi:hypothetical protein
MTTRHIQRPRPVEHFGGLVQRVEKAWYLWSAADMQHTSKLEVR